MIVDLIPTYHKKDLAEIYNEAVLKKRINNEEKKLLKQFH